MKERLLKNYFFIIIGPSGSGKTRITEAVFPKEYKVISHTTRKIRPGEKEGIDYYFETAESFQYLIVNNLLAEYDIYNGNYYGVAIETIKEKTNQHCGYDVLTFKGFQALSQLFGEKIVPIFFDVSREKVRSRLESRESASEAIEERLRLYDEEIENKRKLKDYSNSVIIQADGEFNQVVLSLKKVIKSFES